MKTAPCLYFYILESIFPLGRFFFFCHQGFQSLTCLKECMYRSRAFAEVALSLSSQASPRGKRTSWMRQNHDLDQKQRKELRLRWKDVSGSQRSLLDIETRREWTPAWPLEQLTSRLWLSGRLCAEDDRAVTAPHRANWLAATRSGFPNPQGLTGGLEAAFHLNFTHYVRRVRIKKSDYIFLLSNSISQKVGR